MNSSIATSSAKVVGILIAAAIGSFICGFTTTFGATITGLHEGGWNWQFMPFLFGGWATGIISSIIAISVCAYKKLGTSAIVMGSLFIPPLCGIVLGAIAFPLLSQAQYAQEQENKKRLEASKSTYATLYETLKQDPEIALREKWYAIYDEHIRVFNDSLTDPAVPYSLALLKRFYNEAPSTRDAIFSHPSCDAAFLSEHFQEAYDRAFDINYGMLASIVSNLNTPEALVKRVAESDTLPFGAVEPAKDALKKRNAGEQDAAANP
jgi:hypothetical protein